MSRTLKRMSESTLKKAPRSLGGRGEVLGVGKGAEVGACAWPPSQKLSISLMLSTKQSGITYTLEYFVRELSSSSTCPSRIMIRLRLLKVSMIIANTRMGHNDFGERITTFYGAHLRCRYDQNFELAYLLGGTRPNLQISSP